MEKTQEQEIDRIKKLLCPIFSANNVTKAYLFGSLSQGTATRKSDIDLMIITETTKRFFDRHDDFDKIQDILPNRAVDMLIYTPDEVSLIAHRPFIRNILNKGLILYEC